MNQHDQERTEAAASEAAVACVKDQIRPGEYRRCPCDDCYLEREAAAERGGYGAWEPHEIGLLSEPPEGEGAQPMNQCAGCLWSRSSSH